MNSELDAKRLSDLGRDFAPGQPFQMINLLRFNAAAMYHPGVERAGASGREAYFKGYLPAFGQVVGRLGLQGVTPFWAGVVNGIVAGPSEEQWDAAALVTYPDFETFRRIVASPEYALLAEPHRRAALQDWRLIAASTLELNK